MPPKTKSSSSPNRCEINVNLTAPLGKGSFGVVCRGRSSKKEYAVKIVPKKGRNTNTIIKREIKVHSLVDHPNVAKLYKSWETPTHYYLLMELVRGKTLLEALKKGIHFKSVALQIIDGVAAIHSAGIIHRDLKLENIMLTDDGTVKIIDFGFARNYQHNNGKAVGTGQYLPPEVINRSRCSTVKCDKEQDVWAVGVILYTLLHGRFPFKGAGQLNTFKRIKKGNYHANRYPDLFEKIFVSRSKRIGLNNLRKEISSIK